MGDRGTSETQGSQHPKSPGQSTLGRSLPHQAQVLGISPVRHVLFIEDAMPGTSGTVPQSYASSLLS